MHLIIDATTTQDQLAYAGIGQYTKNITISLVKQYPNIKFSVLLFSNKETTLGNLNKYPNVEIVDIGKYKTNDFKNNLWYFSKVLPKIKKIKTENSIYLCPYFWRNYPSNIMPTILFVHDMNLPMFNMYSQQSPIHNQIRKIQYWKTMNKSLKCKYILCNSETTKQAYLQYYPQYPEKNIQVSYLGVDIEETNTPLCHILPEDYEQKGYLIYMGGGINKTKNSKGVIQSYISFLKMTDKEKAPYLVIAGGKFQDKNQKEVKELYDIIKKENISNKVIFTGFYEDNQKYSLLNKAIAFIHLSMYEGFGFAPIEAMRAKVPTILHKNPVYEELFTDVSVMVDGNNHEQVAKKIYDIYKHEDKYTKLTEKAYTLSKEYTWEKVVQRTYEVLDKVL